MTTISNTRSALMRAKAKANRLAEMGREREAQLAYAAIFALSAAMGAAVGARTAARDARDAARLLAVALADVDEEAGA